MHFVNLSHTHFRPFPSFALPYFVVNLSFALITCVCVSPHFLCFIQSSHYFSFSACLCSTQFPYSASIFRFNKERGRGDWDQITLCNIRSKWIEDFPFSFINPLLFSFSASFDSHDWSSSLIPSIFFNFLCVLNDISPSFSYDLVAKNTRHPKRKFRGEYWFVRSILRPKSIFPLANKPQAPADLRVEAKLRDTKKSTKKDAEKTREWKRKRSAREKGCK